MKIDADILDRFAELSGDENPIHLDVEEAKAYGFPRQVAHGALLVALLSRIIGSKIPGPGAVWMSQSINWVSPVFVGDEIELVATVANVSSGAGIISLDIEVANQKSAIVMKGSAQVKMSEIVETGRVALITGGSRGIGAAIARRMGENGATVAVNYLRSPDAAGQVVKDIESAEGTAQAFSADLSSPEATKKLVEEVISTFGRIDVVVHCAVAAINPKKADELTYADMGAHLETTLGGALALLNGASPGMVDRKWGRFIFLGSAGMLGTPPNGMAGYLSAKQGLWGLVRSMATELGPSGITTNMISPGITVTDLTVDITSRAKEVEARRSPMRRLATVDDSAELVAFLASEGAGYINGINLPVTGGPA
jgi:3-oxoacyl-[acyl-carrier protein] reductase